jgi:uncharacterized protein YcbK (DUF882 family)
VGDLSAHFSRAEFDPNDENRDVHVSHELLAVLERIRAINGRPLRIVSGIRSPAHNARVGGVRGSQHPKGTAADIPPGRATVAQARAAGAVGIGARGLWAIHVDVRPGPPAHWHYR